MTTHLSPAEKAELLGRELDAAEEATQQAPTTQCISSPTKEHIANREVFEAFIAQGRTDFSNCRFTEGMDLSGMNMAGFNFSDSVMVGISFNRSDLSRATVDCTQFDRSTFIRANLGNIVNHVGFYAAGADFSGANLEGSNLGGSDLKGTIFVGTVFGNTQKNFTSFWGSDLSGAVIARSNLGLVSFELANLSGTDMRDNDGLLTTNFTEAILNGAQFLAANLGARSRSRLGEAIIHEEAQETSAVQGL